MGYGLRRRFKYDYPMHEQQNGRHRAGKPARALWAAAGEGVECLAVVSAEDVYTDVLAT